MSKVEAEIIGDIARDEKRQNKKDPHQSANPSCLKPSSNSLIFFNDSCRKNSHYNSENS